MMKDRLSGNIRERLLMILWHLCMGILMSLGIILPILYALSLNAIGTAVFTCVFTTIVLITIAEVLPDHPLIARIVGGFVIFLFCAMMGVFGMLGGMIRALFLVFGGDTESVQAYASGVAVLLGVSFTFCGYNISRQGAGFFPAVSLMLVAFLLVWFSGKQESLWLFLPALIAVCVLFVKMVNEDTPNEKALLASLIIVICAFILTPLLSFSSQTLEKFANTLRSYMTDTLFSPEERNVYSLEVDGYMPLAQSGLDGSEKRLGGPVEMTDRPVMTVETPERLYLRGSIQDYYTGLKWEKTLSTGRYRYADPRNRSLRTDVLDRNRPPESLRNGALFDTTQVHITMQSTSASSLFLPLRFDEIKAQSDWILYFGVSSELHIERDLEASDTYSFVTANINPYDDGLPEVLAYAAMGAEKRDMSVYLQLPDFIAQDVFQLTQSIIAGKISPFEKARAIQNHLLSSYRYTLQPEAPPRYDFVSYFLLSGKEGYCTYFASAMAVMGRIAGLPTRYVEGYVAHPSGGIALVTSKNAHAWAEVYFDGFGWITFDATPAEGVGGNSESPPDSGSPGDSGNTEQNPQDDPQGDTNQEESQNEEPDENGGQSDQQPDAQDGQEGQDGQDQQDEQGQQDPENPNEQADPIDSLNDRKKSTSWWKWLLAFLLLAAVFFRWFWMRMETIILVHCRNDKERLLTWYKGILCMLTIDGKGIKLHETPVAYAARMEKFLPEHCMNPLQEVSDAVTHAGYGRFGAGMAQIIQAKSCYKVIWRKISLQSKLKWLFKRMWSGIGNVRQVP